MDTSAILVILLAINLALFPLLRKGAGRRVLTACLLVILGLCSSHYCVLMSGSKVHPPEYEAKLAEERAGSVLRFMSTINVGLSKLYETFFPLKDEKGKQHRAIELSNKGLVSSFKTARYTLEQAIEKNPDDAALKAKYVVLLHVWAKDKASMRRNCQYLLDSKDASARALGKALWQSCLEQKPCGASELSADLKALETMPKGWYRENAILALYKSASDSKAYQKYQDSLEASMADSFRSGIVIAFFAFSCGFVGVIVLLVQLGSLSRKEAKELSDEERIGLKLSFKEVYLVFTGWLSSQIVLVTLLKLLPAGMLSLGKDPLSMASFSFFSYILSMLPAVLLIYFIALRPHGLKPVAALKIRMKTGSLGPFRILLGGVLSWCAIIPMVVLSSIISSALGLAGSDNAILPQIAKIASSGNLLAIFVLYFTGACLAPFFEEIIFRGFLYSYLRLKIGVFPAILASSACFALIHFDKGGIVTLFAIGPVLAVAFERSRSLVPPMLAHGLWNTCAFAYMLSLHL